MTARQLFRALALLLLLASVSRVMSQDVVNTPHNLATSGPGAVRATTEDEVCIFCHTPHAASTAAPLWNRRDSGGTYLTYESSTLKVAPGQPSGASRLCLSCHDGTIALGEVRSRTTPITMVTGPYLPPGRSRLGLDLSDDHPVSLNYADALAVSAGALRPAPEADGNSLLDKLGEVQCTSCHDAHDNRLGQFLRITPVNGALCVACHNQSGWGQTSHATSGSSWDGPVSGPSPRPDMTTVANFACQSCHSTHAAPGREQLLLDSIEEDTCYACHDGTTAQYDIGVEMGKWRAHDPAVTQAVHIAGEIPDGTRTHVECVDCHNPHHADSSAATGGGVPGPLKGVTGWSAAGTALPVATKEYEICYKCHADTTDSNQNRIPRAADQPSILRRLDSSNPSYHPVLAPGRNPDVPSLKPPWTVSSIMTCGDCHGNDNATGPRGPHGSRWDFLLKLQYDTADPNQENSQAYALCYSCHERNSILGDNSFKEHKKHIVGEDTSCSVCHAGHGIDSTLGSSLNNAHLVNFNTNVVFPNGDGDMFFQDQGQFAGTCSLLCHGEDHRNFDYRR